MHAPYIVDHLDQACLSELQPNNDEWSNTCGLPFHEVAFRMFAPQLNVIIVIRLISYHLLHVVIVLFMEMLSSAYAFATSSVALHNDYEVLKIFYQQVCFPNPSYLTVALLLLRPWIALLCRLLDLLKLKLLGKRFGPLLISWAMEIFWRPL